MQETPFQSSRPTPREINSPPFWTLIGSAMDNSSMDIHHSAFIAINIQFTH